MADNEPRAGELTTANYGWTKPNVGNSDDAWGGMINADLDGIDSTVKSVSTVANAAYPSSNPSGYQTAAQVTAAVPVVTTTTPAMDGTATIGSTGKWADGGHVHPTDTSRYAASNPGGYQTAAQVTAAVPVASLTTPLVDGTAAVGTGTTWARADHVHPTDVSRLAVLGVIDGSSAAAGQIGEVISSNVTTNVPLTSTVIANITSITLTPGDWDVSGEVSIAGSATGATGVFAAINIVSATYPATPALNVARSGFSGPPAFTTNGVVVFSLRPCRANLTVSTVYYLLGQINGAAGNGLGNIIARRVR